MYLSLFATDPSAPHRPDLWFFKQSRVRRLFLTMSANLKFWKPGTTGPGSSLDRASEQEGSIIQSAPITSSLSIQGQRERLPIFKHRAPRND